MTANRDQAQLWNQASGPVWVELQELLDGVLEPIVAPVLDATPVAEGGRVLDVGCGAGATTIAMARRVGATGACVGVDISTPLVEAARARAAQEDLVTASFLEGDAQTYAFEPASFDAVISRFGVMFFDDPVAAFANLRRATRAAGALTFVCWRSPAENPFMTTAAHAAAPLLPDLPAFDPSAPGPFAFADEDRVKTILASSGWTDLVARAIDVPTSLAERDMLTYVTRLGPVGAALRNADDPTRTRVTDAVRSAYDRFVSDGTAHFTAACWLVTARA